MTTFAAALVAGLLLTTGLGHAFRLRSFVELLSEHAVVSSWLTAPSAVAVAAGELILGAGALTVMFGAGSIPARWIFAGSIGVGAAFVGYLTILLRASRSVGGCGCSPLESPLTPVSLAPGLVLLAAAGVGLAAATESAAGSDQLLASLWGLTLAGIVLLVPATVPRPAWDARWAAPAGAPRLAR